MDGRNGNGNGNGKQKKFIAPIQLDQIREGKTNPTSGLSEAQQAFKKLHNEIQKLEKEQKQLDQARLSLLSQLSRAQQKISQHKILIKRYDEWIKTSHDNTYRYKESIRNTKSQIQRNLERIEVLKTLIQTRVVAEEIPSTHNEADVSLSAEKPLVAQVKLDEIKEENVQSINTEKIGALKEKTEQSIEKKGTRFSEPIHPNYKNEMNEITQRNILHESEIKVFQDLLKVEEIVYKKLDQIKYESDLEIKNTEAESKPWVTMLSEMQEKKVTARKELNRLYLLLQQSRSTAEGLDGHQSPPAFMTLSPQGPHSHAPGFFPPMSPTSARAQVGSPPKPVPIKKSRSDTLFDKQKYAASRQEKIWVEQYQEEIWKTLQEIKDGDILNSVVEPLYFNLSENPESYSSTKKLTPKKDPQISRIISAVANICVVLKKLKPSGLITQETDYTKALILIEKLKVSLEAQFQKEIKQFNGSPNTPKNMAYTRSMTTTATTAETTSIVTSTMTKKSSPSPV